MGIFKKLFGSQEKQAPQEKQGGDSSAEKAEAADLTTCLTCHGRTPLPEQDTPWGSAVICVHCHAPLIGRADPEDETPSSVSPQLLEKVYGMTGRALENPRCPHCGKLNRAVVFPARGLSLAWYAVAEPQNPAGFAFKVHCIHCEADFYVEWDKSPLQAVCRICGAQTEDPQYAVVICKDCAAKAARLRIRTKLPQPPGPCTEYVFLVGFGRMPGQADVSALASSDVEARAPHLYTSMLSGGIPQSAVEIGLITTELVGRHGQTKLGHEVDWGKITYEGFKDLLLIKFWG